MSKLITLVIFCFSLCLLGAAIALHSVFEDYRAVTYPEKSQFQDGPILEDYRFEKLKNMANYPFIGVHFSEPYIKEMTKRKQWEHVMEESQKALDSIVNVRSYRIWYYKAVAECAALKFYSCQKSLYQAEFLAPKIYMSKINQLKRIFNYRLISNLERRKLQIASV